MVTLPDGSDVSVAELQEMAAQQQQQIDAQQQMMVAKEQRLKYLKQQEARHQQMSADNERLNALRNTVEAQELKLRKLRAVQGQVEQHKINTTALSSELETIRTLFNEKEKELSVAVAKVDELTKQLEELRRGRQQVGNNMVASPAALELEKLRKELLYRNKLNEQQNNRMVQQREALNNRKDEVTRMDKRISELQQRLQRKRSLNQQLANQINAATSAKQAQMRNGSHHGKNGLRHMNSQNIAAIEPYNHMPSKDPDRSFDDIHAQLNSSNKAVQEFIPNKNDPKYQTLPYNTKFLVQKQQKMANGNDNDSSNETEDRLRSDDEKTKHEENPQKDSDSLPPKSSPNLVTTTQSLSNLTPKPYSGSSYNNKSGNTNSITSSAPVHVSNKLPSVSSFPSPTNTQVKYAVSSAENSPANLASISGDQAPKTSSGMIQLPSQTLPVYQTSSMPVTVVHPHVFNSAPDGSLQEALPDISSSKTNDESIISKPSLPPKPSVPNKPVIPPRQIYNDLGNKEKVDTSSASVDSALTILKGSDAKDDSRPVGKNVVNMFSKRAGSSTLQQYIKSMNHTYKSETSNADPASSEQSTASNEEPENKKFSQSELPIKAKPLTIKKSSTAEPPKLKSSSNNVSSSQLQNNSNTNGRNSNVHVSMNRMIQMPPAFHFPEIKEAGLKNKNVQDTTEVEDTNPKIITSPNIVPPSVTNVPQNECEIDPTAELKPESDNVQLENDVNGNQINADKFLPLDDSSSSSSSSSDDGSRNSNKPSDVQESTEPVEQPHVVKIKKGNLKKESSVKNNRRVSFDPHALLLDASLEGELNLVKKTAKKVPNPSAANDEGITALHNAICAGHFEVVKFLVEFGCDVNAQDSDGWTPLHCAASCNNLPMVKFLVENGACIFATTLSDHETAANKCEEEEEGFDGCSEYLYSIQEKLGIRNNGVVYAVYDFEAHNADELNFDNGIMITVLRKGDEFEKEWWWARIDDKEGYIPRNLLGLYPRRPFLGNQEYS